MTSAPSPWPKSELEAVVRCPVCRGTERRLLHSALTDRVFAIADGSWNLYQCTNCQTAYLDPRPTPASIGRAYAGYYTHNTEDHPVVSRRGQVRRLLHDLINGYENHRYGLHRRPSLSFGRWLLPLMPSLRCAADAECRHLPPAPRDGGRLLDVGCGNGGFLALAQQAGWHATGVDFDAGAVQACRDRGLDVRQGGIEVMAGQNTRFDVITLCHVIEHVHDPVDTLRQLHALLKPGGWLWLDTPNIASLGAGRFGASWRGLEPPRHLVLFSPRSMKLALTKAGFRTFRQHWRGLSVFDVFAPSEAMARGASGVNASHHGHPPLRDALVELTEMIMPSRREFLTLSAQK